MTNYDAIAAAFLAIVPRARRERTEKALSALFDADRAGTIFNVDLKDIKFSLDRTAEESYKAATDHFWQGKGGNISSDFAANEVLHKLVWNARISYVRDAISCEKKLAKVKVSHPMVDAMRTVAAACLPIARIMEDLKSKVVMGRKPNPDAIARKAAKALTEMPKATCGCCFGRQAVLPNGRIHDHGYTLPQAWNKSASCDGRDFRPLEVSDEGPKHMVAKLERYEAQYIKLLADAPALTEVSKTRYNGETKTFKRGEPQFDYELRSLIENLENILKSIRRDLASFRKVVAEWKAA